MKIYKNILSISTALLLTSSLYADQFAAAPGTKARGMGYAFSAVANNTSAAYYNPAGYVSDTPYITATIEFGDASSFDQTKNNTNVSGDIYDKDSQYFLGFGSFDQDGGWGISMYSLFDVYITNTDDTKVIHQSNEVIHLAFSYALNSRISWGWGIAYVSKLFNSDEDANGVAEKHNGYEIYPYDSSGYFANFGLLANVYKNDETGTKFTLSATYRTEGDLSEDETISGTTTNVEPFDIPEEKVVGAALLLNTDIASFLFTVDKKETTYTYPSYASSDTIAMGMEIGFDGFSIRAGKYDSTPQDDDNTLSAKVTGATAGINFKIGKVFWELAVDNREIENIDKTNTFGSISANWAF